MRILPILLALGALACLPTTALADDTSEVSMNFQDVDVRKVFETLAQFAEKNIVISPEVKGKVSVSFRDTPWDQALKSVAQACGCEVNQAVAGVYTITSKGERKKVSAETDRIALLLAESKQREAELVAEGDKQAVQVLQIHSVADLLQVEVDVLTLAKNAVGEPDAKIELQKRVLIVRASGAGQQRLGQRLSAVRKLTDRYGGKHASVQKIVNRKTYNGKSFMLDSGFVWVPGKAGAGGKAGEPGKPGTAGRWMRSDLVKGDLVTTAEGSFKLPRLVVNPWPSSTEINKLRRKAEKLEKAAALLREAGDTKGASSALAQMKLTRVKIAKLQAEMNKRNSRYGVSLTTNEAADRMNIQHAIKTLRGEVKGLRSDVKELTQLVKQLLAQRRK